MLDEILEENDCAWPKSLRADYFQYFDKDTGEWTKVWCPVRSSAIRTRLQLPLRNFQTIMLNSGEADAERYEPSLDAWVPNAHPLAGTADRPMGFLRRLWDPQAKQTRVGFYINTNKTQDIAKRNNERGLPSAKRDAQTARPASVSGPQVGAQVALQHCPILRSGQVPDTPAWTACPAFTHTNS